MRGKNGQDIDWIDQQSYLQKVGAWEGDVGAAEPRAVLRRARKRKQRENVGAGEEKVKENKSALLMPETQGD